MRFGLREGILAVVLMAAPLVAWWWIFQPQNAEATQMRDQIEAKQAKLQDLNHATATIGDVKQRIDKLENAMEFFHSKLPSEKEIDKVLKGMWRLAESNHLKAKSIRTLDRTKSGISAGVSGHREQPILVKLEGNFLGFYRFLQALENEPRIMRIHQMSLARPRQGEEGNMEAEFTMTIFFEGSKEHRP